MPRKRYQFEYEDVVLAAVYFAERDDMNQWRAALTARYLNLLRLLLVLETFGQDDVPPELRQQADRHLARYFNESYPWFPPAELNEIVKQRCKS